MTLVEPASSLTDFALGILALIAAGRLRPTETADPHWRWFFVWIGIAGRGGGVCGRVQLVWAALGGRAGRVLERVGLAARSDEPAAYRPYGPQRVLELAMGVALAPELLIMDEPTQGLSESEVMAFCDLIRAIGRETTVLLIEHNMSVIMELADRITVMNDGTILAEGTPAEIAANLEVQRAYLGT